MYYNYIVHLNYIVRKIETILRTCLFKISRHLTMTVETFHRRQSLNAHSPAVKVSHCIMVGP